MNKANCKEWIDLFVKIENPNNVEILETIDIGYNSTVYLVSVDGKQYAVKMYDRRYNGSRVYLRERSNILKARKSIPDAVPDVVFFSKHTENGFEREILVMEKAMGVPLDKEVFGQQVLDELTSVLKRLHNTETRNRQEVDEIERMHNCRRVIMQFLKEKELIAQERVSEHFDALRDYYCKKRDAFKSQRTMIHGDLWWDNVLVNNGKVKIVDWLESSEQDYCRDLAQLKVGILDEVLDTHRSKYFFDRILNAYKEEFEDKSIYERIRYYLPLMYLEESVYLPFEYFPWEIKYKENAESFEKRFVDYFEKSEWSFKCE